MESGRKQVGSSPPPSSLAHDLFGSKDSSSSTGVFNSIFSPSSKDAFGSDAGGNKQDTQHDPWSGRPEKCSQGREGEARSSTDYKSLDSIFHVEKGEVQQPCDLSSSIYYGGQDIYSDPLNTHSSTSVTTYQKDGEEDDPNSASRGNWWQGSLYY